LAKDCPTKKPNHKHTGPTIGEDTLGIGFSGTIKRMIIDGKDAAVKTLDWTGQPDQSRIQLVGKL
jgi:hypothetical protein